MTENGCLMLGQRLRKPRTELSVAKSRCFASKKISCVSIQFEKSCKLSKPMSRRGCLESSTGSLGELSNLFSCNILSLLRRVGSIVSVFFLPFVNTHKWCRSCLKTLFNSKYLQNKGLWGFLPRSFNRFLSIFDNRSGQNDGLYT